LEATYLSFDHNGDVWAGTKGTGLFRFKRQAVKMFTAADGLPLGVPRAVLAASDGKLWVGSDCGGLSWFDGRRFHFYSERDGLTNSCVFSLAEDRNRDILIGTFGGGIFRFREGWFTAFLKKDKLSDKVAVAILPASDGSPWIPYSDGLRRILDGQVREFTTADGISSNNVLSAYEDRRGVIWVETTGGIDRLELGEGQVRRGLKDQQCFHWGRAIRIRGGSTRRALCIWAFQRHLPCPGNSGRPPRCRAEDHRYAEVSGRSLVLRRWHLPGRA
jgi:ligand-binding sensor domain-containing protein